MILVEEFKSSIRWNARTVPTQEGTLDVQRLTDPLGNVVVLDDGVLLHAFSGHGFLIGFGVVQATIVDSDVIYCSTRMSPQESCAVVETATVPYEVIAAYATDYLQHGEKISS